MIYQKRSTRNFFVVGIFFFLNGISSQEILVVAPDPNVHQELFPHGPGLFIAFLTTPVQTGAQNKIENELGVFF